MKLLRLLTPVLLLFVSMDGFGAKWDYESPAEQAAYKERLSRLDEIRQRFVDHTSYPERDKQPAFDAKAIGAIIRELQEMHQNDIDVPEDKDFVRRLEIIQTPFVDRIDRYQNFLTPRIREIIATDRNSKQYWFLKTAVEKRLFEGARAMLDDTHPEIRQAYVALQEDFEKAYSSLIE